ncbi:Protein cms1 [Elasticomyces elasticus]|nr:Protein cms1 [Elasticomyces elasticus]
MSDSKTFQGGVPGVKAISPSQPPVQPHSKKRKRDAESSNTEGQRKFKKKKFKKAKKPEDIQDDALDMTARVNHAIAHMDSRLLADHVAQRTKRFESDLSLVELEDRYIPEKAILDTTTWEKPRDLASLPEFLSQFSEQNKGGQKLSAALKKNGSPHTIVVTGAGRRAADLTRALRKFQTKDTMVAKLFAKHIKLTEAVETVKRNRIGIGIGTPQRLTDLLDDGVLSTAHLKRIVIDASHIDIKKRGILDMKETEVPLVQLLAREEFKKRYGGSSDEKIELLFY